MTYLDVPHEARLELLGKLVQEHRAAVNLSQERVGGAAVISTKTVRLIEQGTHNPGLMLFMDMVSAMKVRPSALLAELEAELGLPEWARDDAAAAV